MEKNNEGIESQLIPLSSESVLLHSRIQSEPDVLSLPLISCFITEQPYQDWKLLLHFSKLPNLPGFFQWVEKS